MLRLLKTLTVVQIFLYFIKHEVEELVVTLENAGH